ncbi:restriction endonuclease subunit S [Brachyspira aalborgi]|nr:restriction endonuclease subunit S [Brachyspira aalborgi]
MKIDTSGWKEFKLNKLFKISGSKTTPKKELEKCGVGNYPYITTQAVYNGIAGYYSKWTEKGKCLTVDSAVLGTCFYQEKDFSASDHVEILRPNFAINKEIGLFLSIIINRIGFINGYAYDKKRSQTALKNESIFLPVDKSDNPDWEYMENTIKSTEQKIINIIKKYEFKRGFINNKLLYKDFKLGDLFKIKSNPQLNKNSFEFLDGGEYPYFTRTVYNNGILGYVKYLDEEHKIKGNSIAVGLIAMQFFYMEKDFYAGQFTKTIYPRFDNFNKNIAHYFIAILNKNKNKYLNDFIVKYFERDFKNTMVSLPVNKKGMPDFELMENFIKQIEKENNSLLKMIRKVK